MASTHTTTLPLIWDIAWPDFAHLCTYDHAVNVFLTYP